MDQRKIMSLGKSSFVISLPKSWMKSNDLVKGDTVSLDVQSDGSLVVHPTLTERETEREIHIPIEANEAEGSIVRKIIGAYLDGYTLIKLSSGKIFKANQQRAIRSIVSMLYLMIIESEASNIELQTLMDESKASVTMSIDRMHLITHSMCRDLLLVMNNWDLELAKSVISLENDIDQLMFFILRLIRGAALSPSLGNKLNLDPLDCLDYQTLVHRIERIADHNSYIARSLIALIGSGTVIPESVLEVIKSAAEITFASYQNSVEAFMVKDVDQINEIIDTEKKVEALYRKITPLPQFGEAGETSRLGDVISIRESLKKISHYAADIAELTIDRTYRFIEKT